MTDLVLWNCLRLTEGGLAVLSGLNKLTHLSLRGCQQLTDSALPQLVALTALQHLNLTACERMAGKLCGFKVNGSLYQCCNSFANVMHDLDGLDSQPKSCNHAHFTISTVIDTSRISPMMRISNTTVMLIVLSVIFDMTCRRTAVGAVKFEPVESAEHEGLLQSRGPGAFAAGSPHCSSAP